MPRRSQRGVVLCILDCILDCILVKCGLPRPPQESPQHTFQISLDGKLSDAYFGVIVHIYISIIGCPFCERCPLNYNALRNGLKLG